MNANKRDQNELTLCLNNLLATTTLLAVQCIGLSALLYFGVLALALGARLLHRRVFSAYITLYVVTKLAIHWGVVC